MVLVMPRGGGGSYIVNRDPRAPGSARSARLGGGFFSSDPTVVVAGACRVLRCAVVVRVCCVCGYVRGRISCGVVRVCTSMHTPPNTKS